MCRAQKDKSKSCETFLGGKDFETVINVIFMWQKLPLHKLPLQRPALSWVYAGVRYTECDTAIVCHDAGYLHTCHQPYQHPHQLNLHQHTG